MVAMLLHLLLFVSVRACVCIRMCARACMLQCSCGVCSPFPWIPGIEALQLTLESRKRLLAAKSVPELIFPDLIQFCHPFKVTER